MRLIKNMEIKGKAAVVHLGCDKNRVDSETIAAKLKKHGYIFTENADLADLIVVNTCAFIESARIEAIDAILDMAAVKLKRAKQSKQVKLIVTGCLVQKYKDELKKELTEVDEIVELSEFLKDDVRERLLSTPAHYAYLKISEGCNNHCTFCTIPSIKGAYIPTSKDVLIEEAKKLALLGVKELIIVAQEVTAYPNLTGLLAEISKIDGIEWIRLLYCYPHSVSDELIQEIADNNKIVKYIDLPLQHVDDNVLKRMNRRATNQEIRDLIKKLRSKVPEISIRSTFMVGFPGETEEQFFSLTEFLKEFKLDNAGFFAYSREEDTPSASLADQIPQAVKLSRLEKIAALQAKIASKNAEESIGKVFDVIYEDINFERNMFEGRTSFQAPEIDGKIFFTANFSIEVGEIYKVKVTASDGFDLIGEIV